MTLPQPKNPAYVVNDAFDTVSDEQFYVWIAELNKASRRMGSDELLDLNNLSKGISYWYIVLKIAKAWNALDYNNNHWNIDRNDTSYGTETISVSEIFNKIEESRSRGKYQLATIRRYVGELKRCKLIIRSGSSLDGRIKPSMQLLHALANTQRSWKINYDAMSGTMDKLQNNGKRGE